ncbi:hypothetical protein HPB50_025294 [Hyalomma asiaticum]|uniref:Uncharacterized protein n=1 Tax=Hyalomma asiaticum TaxID=266040 RepID=A0ACB7RXS5_HYAAI|nr:hypothetical protein HPB50_025294 [Hyalomma asiaticum]
MSVFFTSMEDVSTEPRSLSAACEKSASAPTTPTETTRLQAQGAALSSALKRRSKGHRVNFPTDDCIVTGYVEPPNPWSNGEWIFKTGSLRACAVLDGNSDVSAFEVMRRITQPLRDGLSK